MLRIVEIYKEFLKALDFDVFEIVKNNQPSNKDFAIINILQTTPNGFIDIPYCIEMHILQIDLYINNDLKKEYDIIKALKQKIKELKIDRISLKTYEIDYFKSDYLAKKRICFSIYYKE